MLHKKSRKIKKHVAKDQYRDILTWEQARQNIQLRKELYKAEQQKVFNESSNLNSSMSAIIELSKKMVSN